MSKNKPLSMADLEKRAETDSDLRRRLDAALGRNSPLQQPPVREESPLWITPEQDLQPESRLERIKRLALKPKHYSKENQQGAANITDNASAYARTHVRVRGRCRIVPPWLGDLTKLMADGTSLRKAGWLLGLRFTKRDCERIYSMEEFKRLLKLERRRYWETCGKIPSNAESRRQLFG
jgi:hypothetical protein